MWRNVSEVLTFAIRKEADAAAFYRMAADRSHPGVKKTFEDLAGEEEGHKRKLEALDLKKIGPLKAKEGESLGLAEILEDVPYSSDMGYADILRLAMKNEEQSYRLYAGTANAVEDPPLKHLLLALAREESGHKSRIEKIYDGEVLKDF